MATAETDDVSRTQTRYNDDPHPETGTQPPAFEDLSADDENVSVEVSGSDMYVQCDDWEFYLGEANGPCRPSIDLSFDPVRLYDDCAYVALHGSGYPDREVKFTIRNVYPIDAEGNPINVQG